MPHWFRAKTYGIGWSLPVTWQGWVVAAVYVALIIAALSLLDDARSKAVSVVALTVLLVVVVAWKGEKPFKWRWGGDSR